jgi:hypothetical protein
MFSRSLYNLFTRELQAVHTRIWLTSILRQFPPFLGLSRPYTMRLGSSVRPLHENNAYRGRDNVKEP